MTVVATDVARQSNVIKHEYEPSKGYCRKMVTAYEGSSATYKVGTVLGKITASGKYKICEATAVDGSQTAAAIVISSKLGEDSFTVAATTDTSVLVALRGPMIVSKDALTLGASVDTTPEKDAVYASLEALGILVETTV